MKKENKKNKPVTVYGRTFKSIKEASEYYKSDYNLSMCRLYRGWEPEEAFGLVKRKYYKDNEKINLNGEYITIRKACKKYNVSTKNVYVRLDNGWSLEEAFEIKYRNKNCIEVTVRGKTFKSIKEATDYYGTNYSTVLQRRNKGWSMEDAILTPSTRPNNINGGRRKPIVVDGIEFECIKKAADFYNLNYGTVKWKLRNGKSVEEVFNLKGDKNDKK